MNYAYNYLQTIEGNYWETHLSAELTDLYDVCLEQFKMETITTVAATIKIKLVFDWNTCSCCNVVEPTAVLI